MLTCGIITLLVIVIHVAVLVAVFIYLDDRLDGPGGSQNGYTAKPSLETYESIKRPSILFIATSLYGFNARWTKAILKNESEQHISYAVRLWELQNVTKYVEVKDPVTKKIVLVRKSTYPETDIEWKQAYQKVRSVTWYIRRRNSTRIIVDHSNQPYTWYDLEIIALINGREGPFERENRFRVSQVDF